MQFNIVLGNPPYNNDLYISFVKDLNEIATDCSIFITPAKWQAKSGILNEQFRNDIVPYMKNIVYYINSMDLFNIEAWGGISYYLITKEKYDKHLIKNVCSINNRLNCNYEIHEEKPLLLYSNNIINIINKICKNNSNHMLSDTFDLRRNVFVGEQERGSQIKPDNNECIEIIQGDNCTGYMKRDEMFTKHNLDMYKCICTIMGGAAGQLDTSGKSLAMLKINILKPNQVPKGSFPILKYFNSFEECISFISYMETMLVSFLYYIGICGTLLTNTFFRFIPDQTEYNHIFTDEELYEKYKITQDEISLIESIIKKRN